ncbi:MAG: hypothetical protein EPN91_09280 [Salinibacterium sp.]|nr:MAG: hypothetical protein EPN91_09280 [Salinibacterium sp.]
MKSANPYDRNSVEIRVMAYLNDLPHAHPITLNELVHGIDDNLRYTILCTVGDLRDDGLLDLISLKDGDQLVRLLPQGKDVLSKIYAGTTGC